MADVALPSRSTPFDWKQSVTSALLVAFTLAVGLCCLILLSCTLTQTRLSTIAFSGVNVSVWKLDDIRVQWQTLRSQIATQAELVATAEKAKSDSAAEAADFNLTYRPARTKLDAKLEALIQRLGNIDPALAKTMKDEGPVERIETLESQKGSLLTSHPEFAADVKEVLSLGDEYKSIDGKRIRVNAESKSRSDIANTAADNLESLRGLLDNLFSAQFGVKPIDPATRSRIENALYELYAGGPLGQLMHSMVILPPEIMTLFLVVAMGVLGSSLQLTHQLFVRGEVDRKAGVYALQISVGAITALVIFIVAKAGVPVVADSSKLGGDTPINPYLVAFLAIISGLMSEQAILKVETLAKQYLGGEPPGGTARYARPDLQQAIQRSSRDSAALTASLGVTDTTFNAWMSGTEAIPERSQELLAAALGVPLRDLFSDIPSHAPVDSTQTRR